MSFAQDDNSLAYTIAGIGRKRDPYAERRTMAQRLLAQGMDTSPVQSPWQGAARLAQALMGGIDSYTADRDEKKATEDRNTKMTAAMSEADPTKRIGLISALDPELGIRLSGQMAIDQAKTAQQREGLGQVASTYGGGGGVQSGPLPQSAPRMAPEQVRQQGQKHVDYLVNVHGFTPEQAQQMVGNLVQESTLDPGYGFNKQGGDGGTAVGMGQWRLDRREALIREAQARGEDPSNPTTQLDFYANEFKTRPEFQQFQNAKTPEERQAALMAYFRPAGYTPNNPQGGDGYSNRIAYGQQFSAPQATGAPQPLQVNMPGPGIPQGATETNGMPPTPSPQGVQGPTMSAPPVPPQRMTPRDMPPQMAAPYIDRLRRGGYGTNPAQAEQAMVADMQRALDVSFENQKLEYERLRGDYEYGRTRSDKSGDRDRDRADKQPQQQFDNSNKLRDEFNGSKVVQNYREVTPLMESMKDAATRPSRAADLNMVYALAKIMDPGSVVREGEMIMVNNTQGIGDRLAGTINSLNGGAMLTPEARARILEEAQSRFKGLESSYKALEDHYGGMSDRFGLRREDVIVPIRRPAAEGGNAPAGGGQRVRITIDGKPL